MSGGADWLMRYVSAMDDHAFFAALISDQYGVAPLTLHRVHASMVGLRRVYQVVLADGRRAVLKARHVDLVPFSPPPSLPLWVRERAVLLDWLEQHTYAAPRIIRPQSDELVGVYEDWHAVLVTFIAGTLTDLTPDPATMAGQALAQLHRVPLDNMRSDAPGLARSWWHPAHTLADLRAQLLPSAAPIPLRWRAFPTALTTSLVALERWPSLPEASSTPIAGRAPWCRRSTTSSC